MVSNGVQLERNVTTAAIEEKWRDLSFYQLLSQNAKPSGRRLGIEDMHSNEWWFFEPFIANLRPVDGEGVDGHSGWCTGVVLRIKEIASSKKKTYYSIKATGKHVKSWTRNFLIFSSHWHYGHWELCCLLSMY